MKRRKKRKASGNLWISFGLILILIGGILCASNIYEGIEVNQLDQEILSEILNEIDDRKDSEESSKTSGENDDSMEDVFNPEAYPEMEMPVIMVRGRYYIGYISFPSLGINLPVQKNWSEEAFDISPCRYAGSLFTDDMVIAGHNFYSQLYQLKNCKAGQEVVFTDVEGKEYYFEVTSMEILAPTETEYMITKDGWDLTVFTCTYGAGSRRTIRCIKKAE